MLSLLAGVVPPSNNRKISNMWLVTKIGFFSVVQKTKGRILTVRARRLEDLKRLREQYLPSLHIATEKPSMLNDYPFRGTVPKLEFSGAVGRMAMDIDYSNFKDAAKKEQGEDVANIYMSVWSALMRLERPETGRRGMSLFAGHEPTPADWEELMVPQRPSHSLSRDEIFAEVDKSNVRMGKMSKAARRKLARDAKRLRELA